MIIQVSKVWKGFVVSLIFVFHYLPSVSQNKEIVFSIAGIEYDDVGLIKLRETLKQNIRVKAVNPAYSGGVAKITVQFSGSATELWDELPQTIKQPFKISSIDNSKIELQKSTQKLPDVSSNTTPTTKVEDCFTCDYYRNCTLDTTVVINDVAYKTGKTNRSYYYFCSNGTFYRTYLAPDKKYYVQILFKAKEPVGTTWSYTSYSGAYSHVTLAKGIPLKVGNIMYDDVMIIYNNYGTMQRLDYYAKNAGSVKSDTVEKSFNPQLMISMKGTVDQNIVGLWKHYNKTVDMNQFYKFNSDGTFDFYVGSISPDNKMPKGKSFWRLNGSHLEMYNGEWSQVGKVAFQKKNDPASGKPSLVIEFNPSDHRAFISEDGKTAWK